MSQVILPAIPFDGGDDDHPHEECGVFGIIGDADANATTLVRFARRIASGSRAIEVREIITPEPRYYEAILCLPQSLAHLVNKV